MRPVLQGFADGAEPVSDILPGLKAAFAITEEEAAEMIPSGRVTVLANRAHWARTYLSKAGCLRSPRRNLHVITDRGREMLQRHPARIDNAVLATSPDFEAWRQGATPADPAVAGTDPRLAAQPGAVYGKPRKIASRRPMARWRRPCRPTCSRRFSA